MTRSFTVPPVLDDHGRVPVGARVRAYRNDTHKLVTETVLDTKGTVTVTGLPDDVDVTIHVTWGGGV
jgi:hypothetical protein